MAAGNERIIPINIEDEMKSAYIDYSMSVIVSRALPDVRDGLKPVHRRVLFGMLDLGLASNKAHKKSARIVGEVLGKYHPHGDSSVYDTMVRMAQPWSLRYPMVDGQGNFGSMDNDSPAAMRYTEARLQKVAEEMLTDINKNTVDFALNFDDTIEEPTVLPAKIPNLLVNGASGIAVGMATNMAPHNLTEVIQGIHAYIANPEITIPELMEFVKAPDFPTGGIIYGYEGVKNAFETGRGRVMMRAKTEIVTNESGREQIIVTEMPYQVNKAMMIQKTAELVNDKKIEGIVDIRDESDRKGVRVVYDLKRDANGLVVLNNLFKQTQLQTSFSVNNIALVKGRPEMLNLKGLISNFVEHRHEVVVRRTKFELDEAERKAHILKGLLIALDHIDEVIKLIRASKTTEEARNGLVAAFDLSEIQAKAILEMRLQKLTGLERDKIKDEYDELMKFIQRCIEILGDELIRMEIIKTELDEISEKYGDERRSEIVHSADEISMEDIIPNDEVAITISHQGYIKRTPLSEYREQTRGGRGAKASSSKDADFIEDIFIATNHNYMLFFTEQGKCYWLKVYEIPEGSKQSKGRAIQNLISLDKDDKIRAFMNVQTLNDEEYVNKHFIVMCTKKGIIKKTPLVAYSRPRMNGINAIKINEGDTLIEAKLTNGECDIIMAVRSGRAIRFNETNVRSVGRTSIGVRGITITGKDEVVGMVCVEDSETTLLVVSANGYGKRSNIDDYRITNRGGKGVKTISVTEKTGELIAIKGVTDGDGLMIINKSGIAIRISMKALRVMGRATQGVRLLKVTKGDAISSVAKIPMQEEDEVEEGVILGEGEEAPEGTIEDTEATDDENEEGGEEESTD
ncbi:MAG: DNA gyrase subunit A [Sphingobacteriales bacterium]|jgi:DNA gyrase subunit A